MNHNHRQFDDIFTCLAAPFEKWELKTRPQGQRELTYVTARTVMNRLDEVLGPENWSDEYTPGDASVICKLTITLPDGQQVSKSDAGGHAGMADQGDDEKSAFSDAFKRVAAKFGVGRYLYGDGVPPFARVAFQPPAPEPAPAPAPTRPSKPATSPSSATSTPTEPIRPALPAGKRLYDWLLAQGKKPTGPAGIFKAVSSWARDQGYPDSMLKWTDEQAKAGYLRAEELIREHVEFQSEAAEPGLVRFGSRN